MTGESVILTPDSEKSLTILLRALSRSSESFSFHIVVCDAFARSEVIKRLQGWSTIGSVPSLLVIPNGRNGSAELERMLVNIGVAQPLSGLVIPEGDSIIATESAAVTLNIVRDRLAQLVNGPLVVLVSPHGAQVLQEAAPDLFDVRSGTYSVEAAAPTSDANAVPRLHAKAQPTSVVYNAEELKRFESSSGDGARLGFWRFGSQVRFQDQSTLWLSGIPIAAILFRILHPTLDSTHRP